MQPPVIAALISGSAALLGAVLGIITTGIVKVQASNRAHKQALQLLKEQADQQTASQNAEFSFRKEAACLEDRKSAYVQLHNALTDHPSAIAALAALEEAKRSAEEAGDKDARNDALRGLVDSYDRLARSGDALADSLSLTLLLALRPVALAAFK